MSFGSEQSRASDEPLRITFLSGSDASPHYALGLLSGLAVEGWEIECIGSDSIKDAAILASERITFHNLRGDQNPNAPFRQKASRILRFYFRLFRYAASTDSTLFHIQWPNRFLHFDRTLLILFYKALGKKLVFTAHNVDTAQRDKNASFLNTLTLRVMYRLVDHIIVHTEKMKRQLMEGFHIRPGKITVIPHGIIDVAPCTGLTKVQARRRLGLAENARVLLFFGYITPYKGLEHLIAAFGKLREKSDLYRLVIAGRVHLGSEAYWRRIVRLMKLHGVDQHVTRRIEFIPDDDIEVFFKSADVLVLPYRHIFQSGLVFLSYHFGLPIVAADVGSLREYVIEGRTGFICEPDNPTDLAEKIGLYFQSGLYGNLDVNRGIIKADAEEKYSWAKIGEQTRTVYKRLIRRAEASGPSTADSKERRGHACAANAKEGGPH